VKKERGTGCAGGTKVYRALGGGGEGMVSVFESSQNKPRQATKFELQRPRDPTVNKRPPGTANGQTVDAINSKWRLVPNTAVGREGFGEVKGEGFEAIRHISVRLTNTKR